MSSLLRLAALVLILWAAPGALAQSVHDIADTESVLEPARVETAGKRAHVVARSAPVFVPFTGLAVEANGPSADLTATVRIGDDGTWGPWLPMHIVRSATDDGFVAGFHGTAIFEGVRFEVRFDVPEGIRLSIRGGGTFDNRQDEDRLPAVMAQPPVAAAATGIVNPPALILRSEWNAAPFKDGSPSRLANPSYDYMTFHHAAGYNATTRAEGLAQVRAIQDLHQNVRGWSDIGYQFVIDRGGRLYQGRPFLSGASSLEDLPVLALGAHVGGANTGNIGVCMLGCYHPPEGSHCQQTITDEAFETYVTLFAFLSERYGVSPDRIRGHRDFSSTACPGDNNYVRLPELGVRVRELLRTGNQAIGEATLSALVGEDGVARVEWAFLQDFGIVSYRLERWVGSTRTVLVEGGSAENSTVADDGLLRPGLVTYRLYAVGSSGGEQRLATVELTVTAPSAYVLADTFPNPTDGPTRIRYYLRDDAFVKLSIFDAAGREVAALEDGFLDGERWYVIPFDPAGRPAGVYFVRMQVDGFSGIVFDETRTVVVVR